VWPIAGLWGNSKLDASTNVTIDGATFHDYRFDESCFADGADCHWECLYVNGGRNVTIKNSKLLGCALFYVFLTLFGEHAGELGHRNLRIENNWFATPWDENPDGAAPTRTGAVFLAWCQNGPPVGYENVHVGFNAFAGHTALQVDQGPTIACGWKDIDVVGNLMLGLGCHEDNDGIADGWTYAYNVYTRSRWARLCSPTDTLLTAEEFPYVHASVDAAMDYHLAASSAADDRVPVAVGCPAADIDGQPRPASGKYCDAGADER
jgi:hypothetical protein